MFCLFRCSRAGQPNMPKREGSFFLLWGKKLNPPKLITDTDSKGKEKRDYIVDRLLKKKWGGEWPPPDRGLLWPRL